MVVNVLKKMRATVLARAMMYKVVVQSVLLYGNESQVVTKAMLKALEIFDHPVARRIAGMSNRQVE